MNILPDPEPIEASHWLLTRPSAAIAAAIVILLLATSSLLLSREFERSERLQSAVQTSYDRRAHLQTLLSLHQDIETGQRGYVLTGDPRFLEPYSIARSRLQDSLRALDPDSAAGSDQRAQVRRLHRLSAAKLAFAEHAIALQHQDRGRRAMALIAEGRGKRIMDAMRQTIAAVDRQEHVQLDRSIALSKIAARRAQLMSAALQVVLVLLLAAAAIVVERSLSQRKRALRRAEDIARRQAAIFNAAKDGIIILNASGSIESLNPAAAAMYGYAPKDLMRRDVGLLFEVAPDRGMVESFLKRLEHRSAAESGTAHEFWARRRDGSTFPSDVALSPVHLHGGRRYVAIVRDISERKQIDRMKTEFVSTVSHELRTPLTSIAGSLGLIAGGAVGEIPGPAARLVEVARNNCQRLIRLINDMLDIEKIESGEVRMDIKPVELSPLLRQAVEANSGFALAHRVRLELGTVPVDAWAMADADALVQVVTNLLSNAVKFSPAGETVGIEACRLDRRWRLSVSDRGSGIPAEFRSRIFGKFAQADSTDARRNGGTGLGLSIVREIVRRLGGEVGFEDRDGGGTRFHVDLPAAEAMPDAADIPAGADRDLPRILHLDDDPDVVRVTAQAFAGRAVVTSVTSLAAARTTIAGLRFDAVILDLALPDGSGLELMAALKASPPAPPVIIFSAEEPGTATPADAMLTKSRASLDRLVAITLEMAARPRRAA